MTCDVNNSTPHSAASGKQIPPPKKPWWKSKTIIGALVLGGLKLVRSLGVDTSDIDADGFAEAIIELIGFALIVIGRITATQKLGGAQ